MEDIWITKNVSKRKVIYDCKKCFGRFASLKTHKKVAECDCSDVIVVERPESRASLLQEIRAAKTQMFFQARGMLKLPSESQLTKRTFARPAIRIRNGARTGSGTVQIMALMYNMTCGLKKLDQLVRCCIDLKYQKI